MTGTSRPCQRHSRGPAKLKEHFGKLFKAHIRLGNQKLYKASDKTKQGKTKSGFVQQAVTRVVVAKHVDATQPKRPTKRIRAIENDGRVPRLLTKTEVQHAPNRRANIRAD